MIRYTVVLKRVPDGRYAVTVPALDGLVTEGESLPHALRMAEEAILAYLDGLRALGRQPPPDLDEVSVSLGEAEEAMVLRVEIEEAPALA